MKNSSKLRRPNSKGAAISEFAPALFVFLILFLFPCVNLVLYAASVSTCTAICEEASRAAAISSTKTEAIRFVGQKADILEKSSMGAFANITPQGGVNGPNGPTGCTLEVLSRLNTDASGNVTVTNVSGGQALGALSPSIGNNSANRHYEYRVVGNFVVKPFLNMAGIPIVGQIPAVGAPTNVKFASTAQIENVSGLDL